MQTQPGQKQFRRVPRLQVLVTGTGRDGTMTMGQLIKDLARANSREMVVEHELYANHVCNLLSMHHETGHRFYLHVLRDLLANMPAHAVSGTTYQFALDLFAEIYGGSLKIIHLKRLDRAEFVRSLAEIIHFRPAMAINMTRDKCRQDCEEYTRRVAGFHLGDMDRAQWEELTVEERCGWHYDKTHELIEEAKRRFDQTLEVHTEDLSKEQTVKAVARFIDPSWKKICEPVHLNSRAEWQENKEKNLQIRQSMLAPGSGE